MKIKLIKFLDYCIGRPLCYFLTLFKTKNDGHNKLQKILIIRPGGIGDAVVLYPSLKILSNTFKNIQIDILAEKRNAGIFTKSKYINNLYLYDDFNNLGLLSVLKNNYDAVIDTEQWHRLSAVVCFLTRAKVRVGFATNERELLFTNPVDYNQDDYEAVSFLNLVSELTEKKHKFNKNEAFLDSEKTLNNDEFLQF
ncbi:MAG: glycosyltransferase family 9 protein, partial [Thermodesulfobacteriota bacterium]